MDGTQGILKETGEFFVTSDSLREKKLSLITYMRYRVMGKLRKIVLKKMLLVPRFSTHVWSIFHSRLPILTLSKNLCNWIFGYY
jgi:hypothetical protein